MTEDVKTEQNGCIHRCFRENSPRSFLQGRSTGDHHIEAEDMDGKDQITPHDLAAGCQSTMSPNHQPAISGFGWPMMFLHGIQGLEKDSMRRPEADEKVACTAADPAFASPGPAQSPLSVLQSEHPCRTRHLIFYLNVNWTLLLVGSGSQPASIK